MTKKTPGEVSDASDSGRVASQSAHPILELRSEAVFQGRAGGAGRRGPSAKPQKVLGVNKDMANLPYLQETGRQINRRVEGRTRQPQQRPQYRTRGAADRHGRVASALFEPFQLAPEALECP